MQSIRLFRPQDAGPEVLTVRTLIGLYLAHASAEGVHGPAAKADREYTFRLFCEVLGDLPVIDLKPFHLSDWVNQHPEWKSVSTRRKRAGAIRAAFQWAVDQERIPRNPFRSVRYGEAERRPEISDEALGRINQAANKPTEAILRFIRLTGCRASEACNATWADVDLGSGIWTIARHKSRKRTGKAKIVALVPEAVELLRSITLTGTPAAGPAEHHRVVSAGTVPANAPVFTNTRGRPWDRIALWKAMTYTKKRAGIETPGALHSIRHTAATAMVAAGAPIALVAAQLGHSSSKITEKWYVDLSSQIEAVREAAKLGVPKT